LQAFFYTKTPKNEGKQVLSFQERWNKGQFAYFTSKKNY